MSHTTWAQIERLTSSYRRKPGVTAAAALDKCLEKAEDFAGYISAFFIQTHPDLMDSSAVFCFSDGSGNYPEPPCEYDGENKIFRISTVGLMEFSDSCKNALKLLGTAEGRGNGSFSVYRLNAYKAELRKLPVKLLMFLLLFQEKARILEITQAESRKNTPRRELEKTDQDYLNFIWAFRELENVYRRLNGGNLRSDFTFTWFEAEWTTGNR